MKIKQLFECTASEETMREEFKTAKKISEVRLGQEHLFYRYFIRIHAMPYKAITKAHLRIESAEVGEFPLTEHYLMIEDQKGKVHQLRLERPEDAKVVLKFLEENCQWIEVGYKKKR